MGTAFCLIEEAKIELDLLAGLSSCFYLQCKRSSLLDLLQAHGAGAHPQQQAVTTMAAPEIGEVGAALVSAFRDIQVDSSTLSPQLVTGPALGVSISDEGSAGETSLLAPNKPIQDDTHCLVNRRLVNIVLDELPVPPLNTNRIESSPRPVSQLLEEEIPEEASKVQEAVAPQPAHASGWFSANETDRLQSHKDATSSRDTGKAPLGKGFRGYPFQDSLSSQAHVEHYRAAYRSGSIGSCLERTVSNDGLDVLQVRSSELGAHLHGKEQLAYLFTEQRRLMNDFFESLDMDQVGPFWICPLFSKTR